MRAAHGYLQYASSSSQSWIAPLWIGSPVPTLATPVSPRETLQDVMVFPVG